VPGFHAFLTRSGFFSEPAGPVDKRFQPVGAVGDRVRPVSLWEFPLKTQLPFKQKDLHVVRLRLFIQ
jgi:hypothetical protein